MMILLTTLAIYALVVLITTTTVFLVAMARKDNSIMDIVYGPVYLIATTATIWLTNSFSILATIVTILVALWSARLSVRILHKNFGQPEDARYAAWRKIWSERSHLYFVLRSYLQIYVLQGIVITAVSLPIIIIIAAPLSLSIPALITGLTLWCIGFGIESIADWQLDRFIARKKKGIETAVLMTRGLFAYSRRPNYFGEALLWWGVAIIALPLPFGYLGIIGPLTITYVVTRITGPMLERIFIEKYGDLYRAYQAKTSYFIPLPPRR